MIRDFLKRLASSRGIVEERPTSEESPATLDRPAHHNAGKLGPSPVPMHSQSGVALVLVLACLVLLTVVVISLMVGATQELNTAKSYSEQVEARRLAASTLELVKGQIWAATTETNSGAAATSWASQPGAIRTFKSGDTNLVNVYKLYSSDIMVTNNSGYNPTNDWATNWASRPDEFIDLNRPVVVGGVTNYPIFNPAATNSVAGFAVTNAPGATTANPLPMPVRWIYVLRNGSLTNYSGATNYDASNPVVGRIAFWTDDDTCKLNINTASATRDGQTTNGRAATSFWDLPIQPHSSSASFEYWQLAMNQPAQGEYQRYPGHPARVNLRTVFTNLTADQIYQIVPRTSTNDATLGSCGGTKIATTNLNSTNPSSMIIPNRLYASVDELFYNTNRTTNNTNITPTSLNQLEGFLTAYNRAPDLNLFGKPRVSMWPIHKDPAKRTTLDRYFATASTMSSPASGGSELYSVTREDPNNSTNDLGGTGATIMRLFNYLSGLTSMTPPGFTSTFETKYGAAGRDQLVTLSLDYIRCVNLYDSSVSTGNLTISKTYSYNTNAFARGDATTLSPNRGADASIVHLPGFGQVVPLRITSAGNTNKGLGRFDTTVSEALFHVWALTWDVGIVTNAPPALVREDDVVTLRVNGANQTTNVGSFDFRIPGVYAELAKRNRPDTNAAGIIQFGTNRPMYAAQFLVAPFGPMAGFHVYTPDYVHRVDGLSSVRLAGTNVFPRDPAINWVRLGISGQYAGRAGGDLGPLVTVNDSRAKEGFGGKAVLFQPNSSVAAPNPRDYELASTPFPVATNTADISFDAVQITLGIYSRTEPNDPIQTLKFNFPSTSIPKPKPYDSTENYPNSTYPTKECTSLDVISSTIQGKFNAARRMRTVYPDDNEQSSATNVCTTNYFFFEKDTGIAVQATDKAADFRWLSLKNVVDTNLFTTNIYYGPGDSHKQAFGSCNFTGQDSANDEVTEARGRYLINTPSGGARQKPIISSQYNSVTNALGRPPDFEIGLGSLADGAYARKPDDGDVRRYNSIFYNTNTLPYIGSGWATASTELLFAPNRQVPSPGIMGGLPSRGTDPDGAWETLLFCPNPAAGTTTNDHRGFVSPPDYLWMDFFNMPIVEPYPISEPFSTAGRINMNYQIVPFTYLTRNTGLQALFSANRITVCEFGRYDMSRLYINASETLKHFQAVFNANPSRIFKSPSEICSMWLYPIQTPTVTDTTNSTTNIRNWWGYGSTTSTNNNRFTGDNLREQPYTALYQNLTTQANTYTVHVYVQALDQTTSGKLIVTGEYRGSYALERFLDPKDPRLPDFMNATGPNAMGYYQFRVNNTTQFLP